MAFGSELVVLVHEWVTGGGLAGAAPARLVGAPRAVRCAGPSPREFAALPVRSDIKVVMTLDARLTRGTGPLARRVGSARGEHWPQASASSLSRPILPCWSRRRRGESWPA